MPSWHRRVSLSPILAIIGWSVAGLLSWLLVGLVGWLGVTIIGVGTLYVAYRWSLDETNAVPSYASGRNPLYKAQYDRQFGRFSPEQKASDRAKSAEFNRDLYLTRTIGLALSVLGLGMFIVHQLHS
jgi:hypothetical protein